MIMPMAGDGTLPPPPVFRVPPPPDLACMGLAEAAGSSSMVAAPGPSCSALAALEGGAGRAALTSAAVVSAALALVTLAIVLCLLWRRRRAKLAGKKDQCERSSSSMLGSRAVGQGLGGGGPGPPGGLLVTAATPCYAPDDCHHDADIYYAGSHMYNTIDPVLSHHQCLAHRDKMAPSGIYDNLTTPSTSSSEGNPQDHHHTIGRSFCGDRGLPAAGQTLPQQQRCCSATDKTYDSTRSSLSSSSSGVAAGNNNRSSTSTKGGAAPPRYHQVGRSPTILDQMWRGTQQGSSGGSSSGGGSGGGGGPSSGGSSGGGVHTAANDSGVSEGGGPPSASSQQPSPWPARCCRTAQVPPGQATAAALVAPATYRGRESPIYAEPYQDDPHHPGHHLHHTPSSPGGGAALQPKQYFYGNNLNECCSERATGSMRRRADHQGGEPKDTVVHAKYDPSTDNVWRTYGTLGQAVAGGGVGAGGVSKLPAGPAAAPAGGGSMRERRNKNSTAVYI